MCGIIAYVGHRANAQDVLLHGLFALSYRGYDSAGIAVVSKDKVEVVKSQGKVQVLQEQLQTNPIASANLGIAHTRWATHGIVNTTNAHPHRVGNVTLVHNGIIENYQSLKQQLQNQGYQFVSETDSEVACACIDACYQKTKNPYLALQEAYSLLQGSFAFAIIFDQELDCIYAMRKESPLLIGIGEDSMYIASDVSAFLAYTNRYVALDHHQIACLYADHMKLQDLHQNILQPIIQTSSLEAQTLDKGNYEHYMLKEIHEESDVILRTINAYVDQSEMQFHFPDVSMYEEIHIVACGSALYAGKIAKSWLETFANIPTFCEEASEYRYRKPLYHRKTLFLTISQSGETADSLAALKLAKTHHVDTFAIVNVPNSTMAQLADYPFLTYAGVEISVATTKAYCAQLALLSLLTLHFAKARHQSIDIEGYFSHLTRLRETMDDLMNPLLYTNMIPSIIEHHDLFYIGRGIDYALCLEGALKIKEISYQHSEAYPAGELKHGSIALIEQGTPVIALITQKDIADKTISNIKEVKARGAYVILVHVEDIDIPSDVYDQRILIPISHPLLQAISCVVVFQMLAYLCAKARGCEIDQPRNLAKSVTVE